MATLSTNLRHLLSGEPGPTDLVVTRLADAAHFRLPNQRCGWRAHVLVLMAASLGAVVLALLFGTPLLAMVMVVQYLGWRFTWHYEMTLNAKHLSVDCVSSWSRRTQRVISLAHIGQFTVVQQSRNVWLQAESSNDETEPILADRSIDALERLARLFSEHHADLAGRKPPFRVCLESPLGAIRSERLLPPLNCRIVLDRQASGIMLDFPAPSMGDAEPIGQWRWTILPSIIFGVVISVSIATFSTVLISKKGDDVAAALLTLLVLCIPLFTALSLLLAVLRSRHPSRRRATFWPRRLILTDSMLIRTMLTGGKQVWYREEIERICVEAENTGVGDKVLWLRVVTKEGEREDLLGAVEDRGALDYRPRAELEWVATELQRALVLQPTPADAFAVPPKVRDWHAQQIQDRNGYRRRS